MSKDLQDSERQVIPRWREFETTLRTAELDEVSEDTSEKKPDEFFARKVDQWRRTPEVESAAEVLTGAIVLRQNSLAQEAARFILKNKNASLPELINLADRTLAPPSTLRDLYKGDSSRDPQGKKVHELRGRLREYPHNAILWTDLSRAFLNLGSIGKSKEAMRVALSLSDTNRFILRCAARLYVHVGEHDRAHRLLIREERTREDPWLLSAEIAVASKTGRTSRWVRNASSILLKGNFLPHSTSELASAVATLEFSAGFNKKARRLFEMSLQDPSENAVAQAGWASRWMPSLDVDPLVFERQPSQEALAWQSFMKSDWSSALSHCDRWLADEPFSPEPAIKGSYIAETASFDYTLAEKFARGGLQINPNSWVLRNNLAVALALQNRPTKAMRELALIKPAPPEAKMTLMATKGLIEFRSGNPAAGKTLYEQAILMASGSEHRKERALASLYLAREELISGSTDYAQAMKIAQEWKGTSGMPEIAPMLQAVSDLAKPGVPPKNEPTFAQTSGEKS